jgi:hypothetical protein
MKELSKFELSLNIIVKYRRIKPAFYGVLEKRKRKVILIVLYRSIAI